MVQFLRSTLNVTARIGEGVNIDSTLKPMAILAVGVAHLPAV
jgi:hypothetical protein